MDSNTKIIAEIKTNQDELLKLLEQLQDVTEKIKNFKLEVEFIPAIPCL